MSGISRRGWLLGTAAAGTALVVGWGLLPARGRLGAGSLFAPKDGEFALNGWIRITSDGDVVLAMPRSEMGQGVHTALPMLAAEELNVPLDRVRIEPAGADAIYGNVAMLLGNLPFHPLHDEPVEGGFNSAVAGRWLTGKVAREVGINATGGSSSVADAWDVIRPAAATARASLLGAASLRWKLPVDELTVKAGVVSHPSGPSAHYGELAREAAATPPGRVTLKPREAWTVIGTPAPRADLAGKVDGSAVFGMDVRMPGRKVAVVRMCPMLGGSPGRVDADAALKMPGVERLVMLPAYAGSTAGFAVIGRTYWHANEAAKAVVVDWRPRPGAPLDTRAIEADLRRALAQDEGHVFFERGDARRAAADAAKTIEATFHAPYLAHVTLEPMNCTAQVAGDGRVEIWAPTQVPQMARAIAAEVAGVSVDRVKMNVTLLGGGFGRRLEVDFVAQAVRVAMDAGGAPVHLVWPREEDTTHDFYRPMQVARMRGWLDERGEVMGVDFHSAGDAIGPRWMARALPTLAGPIDLPDKTTSEGLFDVPYGFATQRMRHTATRSGVPVGFWRAVGHSQNAFFSECFVDELATASRMDPVAFRHKWLKDAPRHRAVLDLAAHKSGWGSPLPPGRARGVALHESFGTVVAQVAEVSIAQGRPWVHRVVCAVDCGTVVNPQIVAQQMESAVIYGLSAALAGRIDIEGGAVRQKNLLEMPLPRLVDAPRVETWLVASNASPAGVGEPGTPPIAPAVANAWHALTGERVRSMPMAAPG